MGEFKSFPNGISPVAPTGNWSVSAALIPPILSDGSDVSNVFNQTGNQTLPLDMDNVPDDLTNSGVSAFTTISVSIRGKKGSKGSATGNIAVRNNSGIIVETNFSFTSTSFATVTSNSAHINFDSSEINELFVIITGTGNTQGFYTEAFLNIIYTDPSQGKIILNEGKNILRLGKIIL